MKLRDHASSQPQKLVVVFLDTLSCMTNFMAGCLNYCSDRGVDDPISQCSFLVLNLPGQPFTLYDEHKRLTIKKIADIYDRIVLKTMLASPADTEVVFLGFGLGSLIASQLILGLGKSDHPIKTFVSFNGIFRVDERIKRSIADLACSFDEANEEVHLKLLDIVNNSKIYSIDWRTGCDELQFTEFMSDEFDRKSRLFCLNWIDSATDLLNLWQHFEVPISHLGASVRLP